MKINKSNFKVKSVLIPNYRQRPKNDFQIVLDSKTKKYGSILTVKSKPIYYSSSLESP